MRKIFLFRCIPACIVAIVILSGLQVVVLANQVIPLTEIHSREGQHYYAKTKYRRVMAYDIYTRSCQHHANGEKAALILFDKPKSPDKVLGFLSFKGGGRCDVMKVNESKL